MSLGEYSTQFCEQPTTVCLIGPSGAGKTTIASRIVSRDDQIVSSDDIRRKLTGTASAMEASGVARKILLEVVAYRASHGHSTIVDATSLHRRERSEIADSASDSRLWALIVEASLDTCIARQNLRARQVPKSVIRKQHRRLGQLEFDPLRFERIDVWRSEGAELVEVSP
jgi:predicted kinase